MVSLEVRRRQTRWNSAHDRFARAMSSSIRQRWYGAARGQALLCAANTAGSLARLPRAGDAPEMNNTLLEAFARRASIARNTSAGPGVTSPAWSGGGRWRCPGAIAAAWHGRRATDMRCCSLHRLLYMRRCFTLCCWRPWPRLLLTHSCSRMASSSRHALHTVHADAAAGVCHCHQRTARRGDAAECVDLAPMRHLRHQAVRQLIISALLTRRRRLGITTTSCCCCRARPW